MPDQTEDKALVASSEFDPTAFIKGIDQMTNSLTAFSAQEDLLQKNLTDGTKALQANQAALKANNDQLTALSKTSATYATDQQKLTAQQQTLLQQQTQLQDGIKSQKDQLAQVTTSANSYKDALANITTVAKAVKANGTNLFEVGSLNQRIQEITAMAGKFRDIFQGKIETSALDDLEDKLASTGDQFQQLREVITFVQDKLGTLDPNTQEFADLTKVVQTGTEVLEQFGKVQDNVATRSKSLTAQLREIRNRLGEMQAAGQSGTEEFAQLTHQAAELQDAIDKTGERIRVFASDTRLIEGGVEALRGFAAGFELVEGAEALLGVKNEAVEESIKRLNAIMAIANGLQEVSNLLKKESTVRLVAEEIATKAYAISQRILAVTLGSTAAASRGLAAALAATGIGALIVAIGIIITLVSQWADATKELVRQQELLNAANEVGIELNTAFIAAIGDSNKLLLAQTELKQAQNEKVRQSDVQRLRERNANAEALRAIDEKVLREQIEQAKQEVETQREGFERAAELRRTATNAQASLLPALEKTIADFNKVQETQFALENQLELKRLANLRDNARDRLELRRTELQQTEDFLKRLEELRKRLLDAQNKQGRQDEEQLAKTAQDNLNTSLKNLDREIRQGKLTRDQGNLLKNLLRQINGVELTTELKEFNKKAVAAQQSLEDEIFTIRLTAGQQRAELLRDQLDREAATISVTYKQEFDKLEVSRRQQLQGVQEAFDQGLISPKQFQANTDRIKAIYTQLFDNLTELTRRKQEELANLAFEHANALVEQLFQGSFTNLSEATTKEIQAVAAKFTSGRITLEAYQRELTSITLRESRRRIDIQIAENEELLAGAQRRLALEKDPERLKTLQDQILNLREEIAQLRRQAAQGQVDATKAVDDDFKRKVGRVASYAQAIGSVVQSIVSFWQQANEAEAKALDRSITLQEKRVEAATRIAERGNAEYLRLEEDRLHELQVKQENNARRQLAINAVLQASQALVAFTSALAQGISLGGPLGGIAIAGAVLGLLSSGYAIIQSLQQQNPQQLSKGTKRVRRENGEAPGVDTVPVMLTEGESVLSAPKTTAYGPTVDAIHDGAVSAEDMNAFVAQQRGRTRGLPGINYQRVDEATDVTVNFDGRLMQATQDQTRELQEQNEKLDNLNKTMKHIGVNVTIDKKGLALSLLGLINEQKRTKRS